MALTDAAMWDVIGTWPLPFRAEWDDDLSLARCCASFEETLAKEREWTEESAKSATAAYRQFLYLKAISGEVLTPSAGIDGAWHLHLSFPEDYARLEARIGRKIPHRIDLPKTTLRLAYARGWTLYQSEFGVVPPAEIWPSPTGAAVARAGLILAVASAACFVLLVVTNFADPAPGPWLRLSYAVVTVLGFMGLVLTQLGQPGSRVGCG